jgi:hypothetical protein
MSDDERLRIVTRKGADRLILELDGELDMATSDLGERRFLTPAAARFWSTPSGRPSPGDSRFSGSV